MTRNPLEDAATSLADAAENATDEEAKQRLRDQSSQLDTLATGDSDPDHGRLARHEHIIRSIADDEDDAVATHADAALESIQSFRETLEGV